MPSSELSAFLDGDGKPAEDPTLSQPHVDDPFDLRPDLSEFGIEEVEKGVCEDTFENRAALRRAKLYHRPVYDGSGRPTGMIAAISEEAQIEKRLMSLDMRKPLLVDPDNRNSNYYMGIDLLALDNIDQMVPPWVIGATRKWMKETDLGYGEVVANSRRYGLPGRCRIIKADGIRCMHWHSGRMDDDDLCRIHLRMKNTPGEAVERARRKLVQAAPYAVDTLEMLMTEAESEPVRLKASTEILDRAGVRVGTDINIDVDIHDSRSPATAIAERLDRLAGAITARALEQKERELIDGEVVEAEIVDENQEDGEMGTSVGVVGKLNGDQPSEEFPEPVEEDGESAEYSTDFDDEDLK